MLKIVFINYIVKRPTGSFFLSLALLMRE